jgi:hypothetical protein
MEDMDQLNGIIAKSDILDKIDITNDIYNQAKKFLVYDEDIIKGFAYAIMLDEKAKAMAKKSHNLVLMKP